eukprot:CAMPEP_0178421662 /NCGR_PEP_ID=MMETSP0689_2-20121128/26763_1 /TAXON_ID=160604 /ORGANISM="Amphidinium massartii, Strain CS-259" /LENGTH=110 /DNA_ID=CAMNT_0020043181 /DNA_START=128 /DNA_END=461 /DNA_ORIENTATION=+
MPNVSWEIDANGVKNDSDGEQDTAVTGKPSEKRGLLRAVDSVKQRGGGGKLLLPRLAAAAAACTALRASSQRAEGKKVLPGEAGIAKQFPVWLTRAKAGQDHSTESVMGT